MGPSTSSETAAASAARTIALQMQEERGRGAVLVGVARVDTAIEHLLQAVMAPGDERRDNLFQPDRPLGSLGAKVALARRLGLIDEPVAQAINALRKLRNTFAHSAGSVSLADPSHSTRLEEVYTHARLNSLWRPLEAPGLDEFWRDRQKLIRRHSRPNLRAPMPLSIWHQGLSPGPGVCTPASLPPRPAAGPCG